MDGRLTVALLICIDVDVEAVAGCDRAGVAAFTVVVNDRDGSENVCLMLFKIKKKHSSFATASKSRVLHPRPITSLSCN